MNKEITKIMSYVCFLILCLFPIPVNACEPVIPLIKLFAGPHFITGSFIGFILAVGIKCGAFAFYETSLPKVKSAWFMFMANIATTFIGGFLAVAAYSGGLFLVVMPFIYILTSYPTQRLWSNFKSNNKLSRISPHMISIAFTGLFFLTYVLFSLADSFIDKNLTHYWMLKLVYIYPTLVISIGLTTLWEEWLVYRMADLPGKTFYLSALRSNLITLLLLMGAAAIMALPARMASTNFLVLRYFLNMIQG